MIIINDKFIFLYLSLKTKLCFLFLSERTVEIVYTNLRKIFVAKNQVYNECRFVLYETFLISPFFVLLKPNFALEIERTIFPSRFNPLSKTFLFRLCIFVPKVFFLMES